MVQAISEGRMSLRAKSIKILLRLGVVGGFYISPKMTTLPYLYATAH